MKKKKGLKIAAGVLALALLAGVVWFANALVGNPVSRFLCRRSAEAYLAEHYPDTDFRVERVDYSFKMTCYYARIVSPSSADSAFTLDQSWTGKVINDRYESQVAGRENTARRLNEEYRQLTDKVLDSGALPWVDDIAFGDLQFSGSGVPAYDAWAINRETLELDKVYDIPALGARAGQLVVYAADNTVTVERAAELLLELKAAMEEGGAPFYCVSFVLNHPKAEDNTRPEGSVTVEDFLWEDIYEDGLVDRVQAAHEAAQAYYETEDAKKQ